MKKITFSLLILVLTLTSCETAEEKKEKAFIEKVYASDYMLKKFDDYTNVSMYIASAKNGHIPQSQFIKDYNDKLGFAMGYTDNLDSIEKRLNSKSDLYQIYIVKDAFWWFSRDSLEAAKYHKEKDSILNLIK